MPGQTVKIIINKVFVPKPINLRPGYDLDYVTAYQVKCGSYDYNQNWSTEWAFRHLDNQIDILDHGSKTFMEIILEKVFLNGSPSNDSIAFTIVLFLDPHSLTYELA
ncbi:hypothetical protein C1645_820401 [Glomus cerebriforme]|uniref:Uncharacterized protein n=1 Tax=Glomus cerebriforme TaxID=658196 RepID=A0A397T4B2_9GLOM|nr:hypothetical protein C1645_820401 [Glomus cerebriforme]